MGKFRLLLLYIQWLLIGRRSVILFDHDGEMNARLVHGIRGLFQAKRVTFGIKTVRLGPDGEVISGTYVTRWEPLFPPDFTIAKSRIEMRFTKEESA